MVTGTPGAEATIDDFNRCLVELRTTALDQGVSAATFRQATDGLTPDMKTVERMNRQAEFTLTFADYLAQQVNNGRIRAGQSKLAENRQLLNDIEARYGVDAKIIVAIWGMESSFGAAAGSLPVVRSLATLSCYGRRQPFFRKEFLSALRILEQGDVTRNNFLGSWAGAFGQTQFLPTSFERLAVDFSGDGRRDIISSTADALASAANYLQQAGWTDNESWGVEVALPAGFTPSTPNRHERRPLSFWSQQGMKRSDGTPLIQPPLTGNTRAGLLIPARSSDQAFLVLPNFEALIRYNPSEFYALTVGIFADRIGED